MIVVISLNSLSDCIMKKFSIEINKKLQFNVDLLQSVTDDGHSWNYLRFKKTKLYITTYFILMTMLWFKVQEPSVLYLYVQVLYNSLKFNYYSIILYEAGFPFLSSSETKKACKIVFCKRFRFIFPAIYIGNIISITSFKLYISSQ